MPHLVADPTPLDAAAAPGRWVRCRSRTWRVLDARSDEHGIQWRLARGTGLPYLFASPPDIVTPLGVVMRDVSRRAWMRHVLGEVRNASPVWWPRLAPTLPLDRLPFQYVPSMAMLSGHHRRLLLADAVGLGKTMQAAMLLHEVHGREPDAATLVVAPAALLTQWQRELRMRARLAASLLDADALRREAALPRRVVNATRRGGCWLISIDLLRQPEVTQLLTGLAWTLLVVDEAHVAAPGTLRLEAVTRVAAVSVRVLLLTATPTAAGEAAAEALRHLGGRSGDRPMPVVCRHSHGPDRRHRRTCLLTVRSSRAEALLHQRLDRYAARARVDRGADGLLPALVLRRRAASCPGALARSLMRRLDIIGTAPSRCEPGLFDGLDEEFLEEAALRAVAWRDEAEERRELERLLTLARSCDAAGRKAAALARFVRRCREPVVVFTAYVDTLRALRPILAHLPLVVVHGRMPDALRVAAIDAFTNGDATVLLTTDASAEGINLHHRCRLVVHADVPSTSRLFMQRNGRVDRHGQTRRVHAVVLLTATAHDAEAMARLRLRQHEDDNWLARVATARCRRTGVAERWLRRHTNDPHSDTTLGPVPACDEQPVVVVHRAAAARWRRLARALTLPAGARSLVVGVLRVGGAPLLSQCESLVAVSSANDATQAGQAIVDSTAWPTLARRHWMRARRLVTRLVHWESETTRAVQAAVRAASPSQDLFAGASDDGSAAVTPAHQDSRPSCAFSPIGHLEQRP